MKRNKIRIFYLVCISAIVTLVLYIATRPIVSTKTYGVVDMKGKKYLDIISISGEHSRAGGAGDTLISYDKSENFYILGVRQNREIVLVIRNNKPLEEIVLGSGKLKKKYGKAFSSNSSGTLLWTVSYADSEVKSVVVCVYNNRGKLIQSWINPPTGIGILGAVNEDSAYLVDEEGMLRIYKVGKKEPSRIHYSMTIGSVIDSKGKIWTKNMIAQKVVIKSYSPLVIPKYNYQYFVKSKDGGFPFYRDDDGLYCSALLEDKGVNVQKWPGVISLFGSNGSFKEILVVHPEIFQVESVNQATLSRRFLMVKNYSIFGELVVRSKSTGLPIEHRIVRIELVPLWKTWFHKHEK